MNDRMIHAIFLLLGIGVLVPWNAFISSVQYFQARICRTGLDNFESWVGLLFNLSSVTSLVVLIMVLPMMCLQQQQRRPQQSQELLNLEPSQPQQQQQQPPKSHSFWLVTLPLCSFLVVFLITAVLVLVSDQYLSPSTFLVLTLLSILICGCAVSLAQTGIVAAASPFPAAMGIHPFVSGQAVGGVLVSAANLLSAVAEDPHVYWKEHCINNNNNNKTSINGSASIVRLQQQEGWDNVTMSTATSASEFEISSSSSGISWMGDYTTCPSYDSQDWDVFVYFLVGSIVLLGCVIGFRVLDRTSPHPSPSQRQYANQYESVVEVEDDTEIATAGADNNDTPNEEEGTGECFRDEPPLQRTNSGNSGLEMSSANGLAHESYHGSDSNTRATPEGLDGLLRQNSSNGVSTRTILRAVKSPAFCIFFTFFVTLSLFPSWTSHLRSTHQCDGSSDQSTAPSSIRKRLQNDLFTPFTFLLFNAGDLGGRLLAGKLPVTRIHQHYFSAKLVMAACARCLFFPLLLLCVGGGDRDVDDARFQIQSDVYSLTVQTLLAVSNGLLVSLAFMHAPTLIPSTPDSQEKSSEMLSFALSFGLLSGSLFSFPVTKLAMEL